MLLLAVTTALDADAGASDIGLLALNLVLLLVTATTLELTIPEPAHLTLDSQTELEFNDLLFFVEGDSSDGQPRDILVQLYVAVGNVGGTTAVVSSVELVALLDGANRPVDLIGLGKVEAATYTKVVRWVDAGDVGTGVWKSSERFQVREQDYGPYVLAPNDVISVRLRRRLGIDWSAQWDVVQLKAFYDATAHPITQAKVIAKYRRADTYVNQVFVVPIRVTQQMLYRQALENITDGFTNRPPGHTSRPIADW